MERTELKTVISSLQSGDRLKVNFGGTDTRGTVEYVVTRTRVWRGRGGSLMAECVNVATSESENIGTFSADKIVNVCVNGGAEVGLAVGTSLRKVYKTDKTRQAVLESQFTNLSTMSGARVDVEAPNAPELAGNFTVKGVRRTAGRNGPFVLDLTTDSGNVVTISSNSHSGVVQRITVTSQVVTEEV